MSSPDYFGRPCHHHALGPLFLHTPLTAPATSLSPTIRDCLATQPTHTVLEHCCTPSYVDTRRKIATDQVLNICVPSKVGAHFQLDTFKSLRTLHYTTPHVTVERQKFLPHSTLVFFFLSFGRCPGLTLAYYRLALCLLAARGAHASRQAERLLDCAMFLEGTENQHLSAGVDLVLRILR